MTLALLLFSVGRAPAALVSEHSDFGANTVTRDTETGLRWLDVTFSANYSYVQVSTELEPGGLFEGFRLASGQEIQTLMEHAGITCCVGTWLPANYGPITALTALVGQTSSSGNCGTGCSFFETKGWYDSGPAPPAPQFVFALNLGWFDNSPPLTTSPNYPQEPIGRALLSTHSDSASPTRGAWLVEAPEPGTRASAAIAASLLGAAALRRRRARSS